MMNESYNQHKYFSRYVFPTAINVPKDSQDCVIVSNFVTGEFVAYDVESHAHLRCAVIARLIEEGYTDGFK